MRKCHLDVGRTEEDAIMNGRSREMATWALTHQLECHSTSQLRMWRGSSEEAGLS